MRYLSERKSDGFSYLLSWGASIVFVGEGRDAYVPLSVTLVFVITTLAAGSRRLHDVSPTLRVDAYYRILLVMRQLVSLFALQQISV